VQRSRSSKANVARDAWRLVAGLFFGRAGRAVEVAGSLGLTPGDMKTMLTIEPGEPKAMGTLAETLHCDASNVTWLVDRLEERGYVERRPHPTDRRVRTVALTREGVKARGKIEARLYEPPPEFDALTVAELETLRDILRKVAPDA
jgi:DNA-binding MarR family transcriptional regulator